MSLAMGPSDHPERASIFSELHSSPFFEVPSPARLLSFALFFDEDHGEQRRTANRLAAALGCGGVPEGARCFNAGNGSLGFHWSLHTEFARYTFVLSETVADTPDGDIEDRIPADWLRSLNGNIIAAARLAILSADYPAWETLRERWFERNRLIGSEIGEGRGRVYTDYRLHPDGLMAGGVTRYIVFDREMGPQRIGRLVQRLVEIETYVSLALLSLPMAKRQMAALDVLGIELRQLTELTQREELRDEGLLKRLENLAAELERLIAESQYRFSASQAYHKLVESRMAELGEAPLQHAQPFQRFIWRRLGPAMMTCATVERRQDRLAQRMQRTTALLRTRVEVTHERQNRELLAGMARRAELQLRLQETVEGLSIWVLSYYAVGLLSHALRALEISGLPVHAELLAGASVPLVALLFWRGMRVAKGKYLERHADPPPKDA